MIRELGINTDSSFNPDVYKDWERATGYLDSGFYQTNGAYAPVAYANTRGAVLNYHGYYSLNDAWSYINQGYRMIAYVQGISTHYVLIDNATSLSTGQLYCYDSYPNNASVGSKPLSNYPTWHGIYVYSYDGGGIPYTDIPLSTYYLKNKATGTYLDVHNASDYDFANVGMCTYNGSAAQKFTFSSGSYGYILQPGCSSTRILNAYGSAPSDGSNVDIYKNCSESSQQWKFEAASGGGYYIHNMFTPSCVLDTNGENALIVTKHGGDSQIWYLESASHVHSYGDWTTVTAATCTANGLENRICSCGNEETRSTNALGHDYESIWTVDLEPTLMNTGGAVSPLYSLCCKNR